MLRIGQLAKELNTTTKTLRFYEDIGLIHPVARTDTGYRQYDTDAVIHTRLIVQLRRLGFTVKELKELLNKDDSRPLRQRLLGVMDEKLRDTDEQLAIYQGRRDELAARHQALLTTPHERPNYCICNVLLIPCRCRED